MQTHHLLATLRIEKPKTKEQFVKLILDHGIFNASQELINQSWEHVQLSEYKLAIKILQQERIRSISLNSHKIQVKLEPLVNIFNQMDHIRESYRLYDDKSRKKENDEKEINQQLSALRFEAERKLKDFINESCLDKKFTQVLQQSILKFQEERNKQNEEQGKEGIKKAKQRLKQRNQHKLQKLKESVKFVLQNDDDPTRSQIICNKLLNQTLPHYKSKMTDKQEQRLNKIMNTKFIC